MSVKEALLASTEEIFAMEAGVTWALAGQTPATHWMSPDAVFRLSDIAFWKPGESSVIDKVRITIPRDEMMLNVLRAGAEDRDFENDFTRDYFLQPLETYLQTHQHQVCLDALILRLHTEALQANEVFDKARELPNGVKITDKRYRTAPSR